MNDYFDKRRYCDFIKINLQLKSRKGTELISTPNVNKITSTIYACVIKTKAKIFFLQVIKLPNSSTIYQAIFSVN